MIADWMVYTMLLGGCSGVAALAPRAGGARPSGPGSETYACRGAMCTRAAPTAHTRMRDVAAVT